jgi:hypothetical protein
MPSTGEEHPNFSFFSSGNHLRILNAPTGLRDQSNPSIGYSFNGIREWKKPVACKRRFLERSDATRPRDREPLKRLDAVRLTLTGPNQLQSLSRLSNDRDRVGL